MTSDEIASIAGRRLAVKQNVEQSDASAVVVVDEPTGFNPVPTEKQVNNKPKPQQNFWRRLFGSRS